MSDRWGLEFLLSGGRLDWHVPDGFHASAAHNDVIAYLSQIAAELDRLPHRYGYDPATSYRLLVQTWDRAVVSVPSLAFGRTAGGDQQVALIPDAYYISSRGYAALHEYALRMPAWPDRSRRFVWRGSVTGSGTFARAEDIPRVRLVLASRGIADADVALTGVHPTLQAPRDEVAAFLAGHGLVAPGWPMPAFADHRFSIDIDGHANAWGLLEKLILGCCVLKVASPFEQWFYPRLHAWKHYVPLAADLSDLEDKMDWCRRNDDQCRWIAANGMRLAATLRLHSELPRSCLVFMTIAEASWSPPRD